MKNKLLLFTVAAMLIFFICPAQNTINADEFPIQLENGLLRLKTNNVAFGKIYTVDVKTDSVIYLNNSSENMKLTFNNIPEHVSVKTSPSEVKPGKTGLIIVTFDATKAKDQKSGTQQWGYSYANLNVVVNGNVESGRRNILSVNATIEEDYSKYTKKQLAQAPIIEFETMTYDFGHIPQGETVKYDFVFTNKGKNDLVIRQVKAG